MADTLLKKLLDRVVGRVNRGDMRRIFYDVLEALDECFALINVEGDDGGSYLYLVHGGCMEERPLEESKQECFRQRHFYLSMPDWCLYDLLLKQMSPAEAAAYSIWGGTAGANPALVLNRSERFFELIQAAVSLE